MTDHQLRHGITGEPIFVATGDAAADLAGPPASARRLLLLLDYQHPRLFCQ